MIEKHIPAGLLLKMQASSLASGSDAICKRVHDHFQVSGLPFFREYTDHSFQHSVDVFKSACDMIPEETFNVLSPDDLNVLLVACLIHDAGLHITEDVFLRMIQSSNISIPEFDKKSWSTLWAEFIAEAQRFSEKRLVSLFGDSDPVREPPKTSDKLSQRDRLLIGEFLRRHHPRFAHEFITGRTLDANGDAYIFLEFEASILDIIGVTARSHGLALRDTFSYLEKHFDLRDFNRIHIIYVMVLVRIADFLQIQSARAPTIFKKLHSIRSPFSLGEWRLHHSVDNITTSSMDPEAILVSATPKTLKDYLKLQKWSQDFQSEIDKSWAILGEIYGRFTREALDKLKLNIRRIRTNFEDVDALQKKVGFVPAPIRFTVSEPELLRLLMEPLYGENPTYGLRELTQNAADSVNELEHRLTVTGVPIANRLSQTSDIEVELHGDPQWSFTIRDRGTGMTLETIRNYFLKAGASFRNSDIWKHIFTDSKGKSNVARTGRFGVGALSAYLIGETVQIYTRHHTEQSGHGYKFQCSIDDEEIEISQQRGSIGTEITIWSTQSKILTLAYYLQDRSHEPFYYVSAKPTINFSLIGAFPERPQPDKYTLEKIERDKAALSKSAHWISVKSSRYENVTWDRTDRATSNLYYSRRSMSGYLYCNGIIIGDIVEPSTELIFGESEYGLLSIDPPPTVSITDHNANLPVDLARKGLSRRDTELSSEVISSVYSQLIDEILAGDFNSANELVNWWRRHQFPISAWNWIPFLFTKGGFCLLDRNLIHLANLKRLVVQQHGLANLDNQLPDAFFDKAIGIALRTNNFSDRGKTGLLSHIQGSYYQQNLPIRSLRGIAGEGPYFLDQYFIFEASAFNSMTLLANAPNYLGQMKSESRPIKIGAKEYLVASRFSDMSKKSVAEFSDFFERLFKIVPEPDLRGPMILWDNYSNAPEQDSVLAEIWAARFKKLFIPYDRKKRSRV